MVGGIVIGIVRKPEYTLLNVQGTGCEKNEYRTVRVREYGQPRLIELDDSIWWQCGQAYWSPAPFHDIPLGLITHT